MLNAFEFEKGGFRFSFRNPTWDDSFINASIQFEFKIIGVKENTQNDGYFYCAKYSPQNNTLNAYYNITLEGNEVTGVVLPENLIGEVNAIYEELREKNYKEKLNSDIKYRMNDYTAYGIYNGISQFSIGTIINFIAKELNYVGYISFERIADILNGDEDIKHIAEDKYKPDDENPLWCEDYLSSFKKMVGTREAPGYGLIPNAIIKEKIRKIISDIADEENAEIKAKNERLNSFFKKAKETGEKQLIESWYTGCNDPNEECSLDMCYLFAMPDGTKKQERHHTW